MRFITFNVALGLNNKVVALEHVMNDGENPDFIGLQEIGGCSFTESTMAGLLQRRKYNVFFLRRADNPNAGGVALLVRNHIHVEPYEWAAAVAFIAEGETVSVRVFPADNSAPFIVTSLYVHGSSTDTDGFRTLIRSMRPDQVLLTDANAQMPGSRPGAIIAAAYKERGIALRDFIIDSGAMYPTPAGPTRRQKVTLDGVTTYLETGTYNDHIVVGSDVAQRLASCDPESVPMYDIGCSDHSPLIWAAVFGATVGGAAAGRTGSYIAWHKVTTEHTEEYNRLFRKRVNEALEARDNGMLVLEGALSSASAKALPHTRPRDAKDGLYWTEAAAQRIAETVAKHGDAAQAVIAREYQQIRREKLAREAPVAPNAAAAWHFAGRIFGFKQRSHVRGRLAKADGGFTESPEQRVEELASHYAAAHADPPGTDAQQELADVAAKLPPPVPREQRQTDGKGRTLSATELRACISTFASGRCADRFGLRAEHLKMLDDDSLKLCVPFLDRCIFDAQLPNHWRDAVVTPVLKKKRDVTLCKSWRPISVTMLLCRLCEHVVLNRVQHAIETRGLRRGKSQFGFRRGVGTSLPLSGLAMFVRDGLQQQTNAPLWNAANEEERDSQPWGARINQTPVPREHFSLASSVDASDAYCHGVPAKAVQKLADVGLDDEARWIAKLLASRSLTVAEDGLKSESRQLDRGLPQGSVLGPLLWSLLIDDLIAELEEACSNPLPGCVVVPIIFADDINFVVRGPNPTSLVEMTNMLFAIVRKWADANGIPMSKIQAMWIVGDRARALGHQLAQGARRGHLQRSAPLHAELRADQAPRRDHRQRLQLQRPRQLADRGDRERAPHARGDVQHRQGGQARHPVPRHGPLAAAVRDRLVVPVRVGGRPRPHPVHPLRRVPHHHQLHEDIARADRLLRGGLPHVRRDRARRDRHDRRQAAPHVRRMRRPHDVAAVLRSGMGDAPVPRRRHPEPG